MGTVPFAASADLCGEGKRQGRTVRQASRGTIRNTKLFYMMYIDR